MPTMLSQLGLIRPDATRELPSCLVSGQDPVLRSCLLRELLGLTRQRGDPLILIDDGGLDPGLLRQAGYQVLDLLQSGGCLYQPFAQLDTISGVSRFRQLLFTLGYDQGRSMKLLAYLRLLQTLEAVSGRDGPLSVERLRPYGSSLRVQGVLRELEAAGALRPAQVGELLARYAEVSDAAPDFEHLLLLLAPLIGGEPVRLRDDPRRAVLLSLRELDQDPALQRLLLQLVRFALREVPRATVLILDRGQRDDQSGLLSLPRLLPEQVAVHLISQDVFLCPFADLPALLDRFPLRLYGRHETIASCEAVERLTGEIDTVRRTHTDSYDLRLRENSPFDVLFGRNRAGSDAFAAERQPRFRRETIHRLAPGSAVAEYGGTAALISCL